MGSMLTCGSMQRGTLCFFHELVSPFKGAGMSITKFKDDVCLRSKPGTVFA